MSATRLQQLHDAGQSLWLDYIDRAMLRDGSLARRIREDVLTGMTSNPTIFEKALAEGRLYDDQISAAAASGELTAWEVFELVATDDVRAACDEFSGVYETAGGRDGFVSIEVAPALANEADATVEEARRLWLTVDRPNVMIKVPGTEAGAKAVRQLIADGINVNVTLLFSIDAYRRVIEAYLEGIGERVWAKKPVGRVASVASFFVSRVDSAVDKRLDALIGAASPADRPRLQALKGTAAIANARLAYRLFREQFAGERWEALHGAGARVQRPLWASTSTKNPTYRDVMYVEQLIGPDTVNTLPPATLEAFRDHGVTARTVDADYAGAERIVAELESSGIAMGAVTDGLLEEGVESFQASFNTLIAGLERKSAALGKVLAGRG